MKIFLLLLFLTACTVTGNVIKEYGPETEVYFCPKDDCRAIFLNYLINAESIDCALHDLNVPEFIEVLKDSRLIMDNNYEHKVPYEKIIDPSWSTMHNKFCILDNATVITGSMNPTIRGTTMNNNNLLVFHSQSIVQAFAEEFEELYNGDFSNNGKATSQTIHYYNNEKIETYFCPEDWCANKILYALDDAVESIYFMTFAFTHEKIGDLLIKKKNQGLDVKGVIEARSSGKRSQFPKLNASAVSVVKDHNKATMHHKVFIVDRKIVITGSMNPTMSGDTRNDENLLIIHSPEMAALFLQEFVDVYK